MSDRTFKLTLVTPERTVLDEVEAVAVDAQGMEGRFNALPGHEPFLTALSKKMTTMWYRDPQGVRTDFVVEEGFVEVLPDRVTILAGYACAVPEMEKAEFMELEKQKQEELQKRIEEAQKKPEQSEDERIEINELELQLQKSMIRVQMASQRKKDAKN